MFSQLPGNDLSKKFLTKLLASGRVPHLMLFSGPEGVGMGLFARIFASRWLNIAEGKNHPDLHEMMPEGKTGMHSMQSIQGMIEKSAYLAYEGKGKVFIIDSAERMLPSSANALLKTIEEPPAHTLIILVTSAPDKLLPTIRSRCQVVRFAQVQTAMKAEESQEYAEVRKKLFAGLKSLRFDEQSQLCEEIQELFEEKRKRAEKEVLAQYHEGMKEMNAAQKNKIELEVEGALSTLWLADVDLLLRDVYGYFRDLTMLAACGSKSGLVCIHDPSHYEGLVDREPISMEKVEKAIAVARLGIERFMPLKNALESLLLSLC